MANPSPARGGRGAKPHRHQPLVHAQPRSWRSGGPNPIGTSRSYTPSPARGGQGGQTPSAPAARTRPAPLVGVRGARPPGQTLRAAAKLAKGQRAGLAAPGARPPGNIAAHGEDGRSSPARRGRRPELIGLEHGSTV